MATAKQPNTHKDSKLQALLARESQARVDILLSSIGEGLVATDEKGLITRINKVALDMLGYKESDVVGRWFPEVMVAVYEDGSLIQNVDRPITKAFLSGQTINEKTNYQKPDGTMLPVSLCVSPVMLRGKPVGAIQVFRDISEDIVLDKMKSDFISLASHQLRTPLTAINTYAHLLADGYGGELSPEHKLFLDVILSASNRMNELISTQLNITRIESGSLIVEPLLADLTEIAESIVSELQASAKVKSINLTLVIGRNVPQVKTDALLVQEVFATILSNALKYTPEGGKVAVSLTRRSTDVLFKVRDNGYGIPDEAQTYIFKKFFRAGNVTLQEPNGTGLGLYLINMIADALSGEVWFKSREDVGSTFYFSLPQKGSIKKEGKFKLKVSR